MPTQDLWIPTSRVLKENEFKLDLQTLQSFDKTKSTSHQSLIGAEYGIFEREKLSGEIGLDWREPVPDTALKAFAVNGRLAYNRIEKDGWAIAVGLDRFALDAGIYDYNLAYLVFENQAGPEWIMEVGGVAGNEARIRTSTAVVLGLWKSIQEGFGRLGVELFSGQGPMSYAVPGIRVTLRDGVEGVLAYQFALNREAFPDFVQLRLSVLF